MSAAVIVLNIAYLALVTATLTRTVQRLRLVLVVSSMAFITFGVLQGIWSMVGWNVLIGGMHVARLAMDRVKHHNVSLTKSERRARDSFFPGLGDADFYQLWCMGATVTSIDTVMVREGSRPSTLSLVLDGTAVVERGGQIICGIRRGGLIGEMSFVTGNPSEVDVVARGTVLVRQWSQRQVASLDKVNPECAKALRKLLSQDLVAKARVASYSAPVTVRSADTNAAELDASVPVPEVVESVTTSTRSVEPAPVETASLDSVPAISAPSSSTYTF